MITAITIYSILNILWVWFAMYKVGQYKTAQWYHKVLTFLINLTIFPIAFVVALFRGEFTTQADNEGTDYKGEDARWFQLNELIIIRRVEDDNKPYLVRRTLISFGQWFSIKYHKILLSDDFCNHDHPWGFLTFILKGGYFEWTPAHQKDSGERIETGIGADGGFENRHWHKPGSIMYRPANWIHRLELREVDVLDHQIIDEDGIENFYTRQLVPAHTLVFTGKVIRDWGFFTKDGWIFWENYSKAKHC